MAATMRTYELCCMCGRLLNANYAVSVRRFSRLYLRNTMNELPDTVTAQIGGREMKISTGKLARNTGGSALVEFGDTAVLASAIKGAFKIEYREKARPYVVSTHQNLGGSDEEIIISRSIDHALRPLMTIDSHILDTQVITDVLSADGVNKPDVLAINAASAALSFSNVPWIGPVGAVRVCVVGNSFVINPTMQEQRESTLDVIVAAADGDRIVMLEGSGDRVPCQVFCYAVKLGVAAAQPIIEAIRDLQQKCGKSKQEKEKFYGVKMPASEVQKDYREQVLKRGIRWKTGRKLHDLRFVSCKVGVLKALHGSALFQHGQTQVLCSASNHLPESQPEKDSDSLVAKDQKFKNFSIVYELSPYAVEQPAKYGLTRRDIGHGNLARNALRHVFPDDSPFFTRLSSSITETGGSSSMATVSGCCLALQQAGIQISEPVAGVAMGLVADMDPDNPEKIKDYALLTDITGFEDKSGDMDFKVAGTARGITAVQLDINIPGIPLDVVKSAVYKATDANRRIIEIMNKIPTEPSKAVPSSDANSQIVEMMERMPIQARKAVPFPDSPTFASVRSHANRWVTESAKQTTSREDVLKLFTEADNGRKIKDSYKTAGDTLTGVERETLQVADAIIENFRKQKDHPVLVFSETYKGKVVEIRNNGVMVQIHPDMEPAFASGDMDDEYEVGQKIIVKYFGADPVSGHTRFSIQD